MAAKYVDISREQLEAWLDSLVATIATIALWTRKESTQGVYQLHLSDAVCVVVSSTQTRDDTAKGCGQASTDIRLASLVTGKCINRKASGQKRFHRTTNWQTNWRKAVERFCTVYEEHRPFYERIAREEPFCNEEADPRRNIRVTYTALDGYRKTATLRTLGGARGWAQRWIGETPEIGSTYAVSGDGIGKIEVVGASLYELFPRCDDRAALAREELDDARSRAHSRQSAWADPETLYQATADGSELPGLEDDTSELEHSLDGHARREQDEAFPPPARSARPALSPEDAATEEAISEAESAAALQDWERLTQGIPKDGAGELLAQFKALRDKGLERLSANTPVEAPSSPADVSVPKAAQDHQGEPTSRQAAAEAPPRRRLAQAWGVQAVVDGEPQYVAVLSTFEKAQESCKRAAQAKLRGAKVARLSDPATQDMARLQARAFAAARREARARAGYAVTALVDGRRQAVRVCDDYWEAADVAKQASGSEYWHSVRVIRVVGADLDKAERQAETV